MRKVVLLGVAWLAFAALTSAQTIDVGIFEDLTTTNVFACIGPDATTWNFYVLLGGRASLYGSGPIRHEWLPSLAADFPSEFVQQEDGTWAATVPLRKGIKWSDGTEFTADDVVFTYQLLLTEVPVAPGSEETQRMSVAIGGNWPSYTPDTLLRVEKVNDYTVKFVYSEKPGLGEWQYGALYCLIVQKKFWEPYFQEALETEDPAGTLMAVDTSEEPVLGGYIFYSWEPGAYAEVIANEGYSLRGQTTNYYVGGGVTIDHEATDYHFEAYGGVTGDVELSLTEGPYVESLIHNIYLNQDAAVLALEKGEIAFILNPLGLQRGFLDRLRANKDITIISNPPWGFRYIAFNMRRTPMNYKAFRVAIATLIDREFLAENIFPGIIVPYYSAVPSSNPFWYNPDVKVYGKGMTREERVKEAVRVLKEAGFSWDAEPVWVDGQVKGKLPDGTIVDKPSGFKLPDGTPCPEIEMLAPSAGYDPLRATFALYIERWVQEIGIPLKAKLTGFNVIVDQVWPDFNFDIYMLGWGLGDPAFPDFLYYFWHSSQDVPDGFNTPGYRNPEFDELAEKFLKSSTVEEAREYVFKMQEILAEDVPYVILFGAPIVEAFRHDLIEFPFTEVLDGLQNLWPMTTMKVPGAE